MGLLGDNLNHLLMAYGYWAVLVVIALESTGIPLPGETILIAAGIYAGTTHRLSVPLLIVAAAAGAILGDNLGYWIGREGGFRLLRRYGRYIRLDDRKIKVGQYLFLRYGGTVVFFGRFVSVLRAWAAFLAGTDQMPWGRFLFFNSSGGILWAAIYGLGSFLLGESSRRLAGPLTIAFGIIGAVVVVIYLIVLSRHFKRIEDLAEQALPGPLSVHRQRQHQQHRAARGQAPSDRHAARRLKGSS